MGLYQNRIVVKVGTSTLTNELGKSDLRAFDRLACVLSDIQNMGHEVILVSSGAIAVGANKLNMEKRPTSMRMKQAAAAVEVSSRIFFMILPPVPITSPILSGLIIIVSIRGA